MRWKLDPARRKRAFILIYAIGTLTIISSLALQMLDGTASELEISRTRMHLAMARIAAESGVEYGMGIVTRELGLEFDPIAGIAGGPWRDPSYQFNRGDMFWFYSKRAFTMPLQPGLTDLPSQAEGRAVRLHQLNDPVSGATLQATQFQLALTPEPTYTTVRMATNQERPTVFVLRSRGEVLTDPDGQAGPLPPVVLASAYALQTFIVGLPENCTMPKVTRQVFDREPATLTPQGLPPPNPH